MFNLLNKMEMVTTESLKVSNNENDKAFYKWVKE